MPHASSVGIAHLAPPTQALTSTTAKRSLGMASWEEKFYGNGGNNQAGTDEAPNDRTAPEGWKSSFEPHAVYGNRHLSAPSDGNIPTRFCESMGISPNPRLSQFAYKALRGCQTEKI